MMVQIDGSMGEGGGQVLRSSLALSMITGKPVTLQNIRAGRNKPGLLRQHLTALRAAATVSGAKVEGDTLHSKRVVFSPGKIRPGQYRFAVGTAGSASLVFQTILPALMVADGDSTVTVEGGTHNSKAPPFAFIEEAFLPLVRQMGPQVEATLIRPGFYPAGGGRFDVTIHPSSALKPLTLRDVGERQPLRAQALVSALPRGVGHREIMTLKEHLELEWRDTSITLVEEPRGPGNALHVFVTCACLTEVFTGFGERRKRAEEVAETLAKEVLAYLETDAPVGEHLADQLLLPLALAGSGQYRATPLSRHTTTNIAVIQKFLDVSIQVRQEEGPTGTVEVTVG